MGLQTEEHEIPQHGLHRKYRDVDNQLPSQETQEHGPRSLRKLRETESKEPQKGEAAGRKDRQEGSRFRGEAEVGGIEVRRVQTAASLNPISCQGISPGLKNGAQFFFRQNDCKIKKLHKYLTN